MIQIPHVLPLCNLRHNCFKLLLLDILLPLLLFPFQPPFFVNNRPLLLLPLYEPDPILLLPLKCDLHPIELALQNIEFLIEILVLHGLIR
jgi:hypothetical protein